MHIETETGISLIEEQATERYIKLRYEYKKYSIEQSEIFRDKYKCRINNLDDLIRDCDAIVEELLSIALDKALVTIVDLEIYDLGKDTFRTRYLSPYNTWQGDFQPIQDKYDELTLNSADLKKKRENASKQSSGGIIGGGFGVQGAVEGIAIATAANLALSALQGMANATRASMEAGTGRKQKASIFENENLVQHLVSSVEKLIFSIHFAIVDVANEITGESKVFLPPSQEDILRSSALLETIKTGRVSKEKAQQLIPKAIELNPYDETIYKFWISQYGDKNNEIVTIADHYGIDGIFLYKKHLIDAIQKEQNFSTLQSCQDAATKLREYCAFMGIVDTGPWLSKIDVEINRINTIAQEAESAAEKESRFFNGILYSSVEEMELEKDKKKRTVDGVLYETQEAAETAHNKKIEMQIDRKKRTVNGITYQHREDAERQRDLKSVSAYEFMLILLLPIPNTLLLFIGKYKRSSRAFALIWTTIILAPNIGKTLDDGIQNVITMFKFGIIPFGIAVVYDYFSEKRRIQEKNNLKLLRESYPKGTPHGTHFNVVWDGRGELIPADGYVWVSSDDSHSVKPINQVGADFV